MEGVGERDLRETASGLRKPEQGGGKEELAFVAVAQRLVLHPSVASALIAARRIKH